MIATEISTKWQTLLKLIPNYNPFEFAGNCYFDEDAAQRVLDFFPQCLKHIKGPKTGQPFELEPWQQSILANLFGWKIPNGLRRYREAFIFVGRKNGKTPLGAGIVLYGLFGDGEGGAEIYSAAADREQAKLVFGWAKGMILRDKDLQSWCRIYQNSIVAVDPETGMETGSFYKPVSSESSTKHGYNSHIVIVDELHAQPNRELVDVLETSTGARSQPLMIHITTSDFARESICNEKYDYACKVRDGIIDDPTLLPVIYEADKDDDWTLEETWRKANPNYGVSVQKEYIKAKCQKAQDSPSFENTFKRLHLNLRTEQDVRWLNMEKWNACNDKIPIEDLVGKSCFAGVDLSTNTDITAFVKLFSLDDGRVVIAPRFYIPEENARKRELRDKVPFLLWAKQGYIKLTSGNVVDYDTVKADIEQDFSSYKIEGLAFDRWNFEAMRQNLIAEGLDEKKIISFGMGFVSLSAPTKELERLVLSGLLVHNGNPVLKWMASNVTVEQDAAGNIKPSKKKSIERIDGIVAMIMALGLMVTQPQAVDRAANLKEVGI